jgi:hypothetical protein
MRHSGIIAPAEETPEQVQARVQAIKAHAAAAIEKNQPAIERKQAEKIASVRWRSGLCEQMGVCKRYGAARQNCAVAGDFNNCVKVRMGEDYYRVLADCHDNGQLRAEFTDAPSAAECFMLLSTRWLR